MPTKLANILKKVDALANRKNANLLNEFYEYLRSVRTSERYQNEVLKVLIKFSEYVKCDLDRIQKREQILAFLNTKRKLKEDDPDERWITTWNDYLWRLKTFYRWLYNFKIKEENQINYSDINNWNTPNFVNINKKNTKRLSPYN